MIQKVIRTVRSTLGTRYIYFALVGDLVGLHKKSWGKRKAVSLAPT